MIRTRLDEVLAAPLGVLPGRRPAEGMTPLEAVSYVAWDSEISSFPQTCDPFLAAYVAHRAGSAMVPDRRTELLRPTIPFLVGSRVSEATMARRAWELVDYALRVRPYVFLAFAAHDEVEALTSIALQHTMLGHSAGGPLDLAASVLRSRYDGMEVRKWFRRQATVLPSLPPPIMSLSEAAAYEALRDHWAQATYLLTEIALAVRHAATEAEYIRPGREIECTDIATMVQDLCTAACLRAPWWKTLVAAVAKAGNAYTDRVTAGRRWLQGKFRPEAWRVDLDRTETALLQQLCAMT